MDPLGRMVFLRLSIPSCYPHWDVIFSIMLAEADADIHSTFPLPNASNPDGEIETPFQNGPSNSHNSPFIYSAPLVSGVITPK